MKGKARTIVLGCILGLAAILVYAGVRGLARSKSSATQGQKLVQVTRGSIEVTVEGSGNVAFAEDVEIRAQTSGKVTEVLVKDGQRVTAGQPLFVMENDSLELEREKAQSNVETLTRAVKELREDLGALRVTAPESGRVTEVAVSEGQQVGEGETLLTLVDDNTFSVTVNFLKTQRDQIKAGDQAEVFLPDFLSSLKGKVVKVATAGQPGSGGAVVYPVTVEFPNPGALEKGTSAVVKVETKQGQIEGLEAGTIEPKAVAQIRSKVAAEVKRVNVEANDKVNAGQVLVELANEELPGNLAEQEDALRQAKMELTSQESKMAKLVITAPISGVFRENDEDTSASENSGVTGPIQVGDELEPNDAVGRIVNNSSYEVVVNIDELDISQVQLGQKAAVTIDALPGQTLEGTVVEIAEEGVVQSGAAYYPVTISLPPISGLKAGMTANARIHVASKESTLLLPVEAVQESNGQYFVLVPTSSPSEGGKVTRKEIKVGLHNESYVEVLAGLNEGDKVVVSQSSATTSKREEDQEPPPGPGMMPGPLGPAGPRS